ncbi:hypothetical protein L2E82_45588 [Cichorium intybus]|uniref:Uncharacterized protein n=1 Tax=Cichorium intybus TaxID=13427 RepID=A0ACB8ZTR5_CICIN|nr:hypothetical protein L2E82_45588 [Cichorium intybus]
MGFTKYYMKLLVYYDVAVTTEYEKTLPVPGYTLDDIETYDDGEIVHDPWGIVFRGKLPSGQRTDKMMSRSSV